jgi:hypothetical protein
MSMPEESAEVADEPSSSLKVKLELGKNISVESVLPTEEKKGKDEKDGNGSALVSSPNKAKEVTPVELSPAAVASAAYAGDEVMTDASVIPPASLSAPRIDLQSPSASRRVMPTVPLSQLYIYKRLNPSAPLGQNAATPVPERPTFMPAPELRATGFSDLFQPLQAARPITLPTPASLGIPPAAKKN